MLLLIFSIARKGSMKYGFLLAAIALLIVAHRAYLMFSPAIYMMLLTAVYVNPDFREIKLMLSDNTILKYEIKEEVFDANTSFYEILINKPS